MTSDTSPRLALSPVTISQCGFEESFQIAAEAGFKGIGLRYDRMEAYLANGKTIADVKKLSRTFALPFAEAAFLAEWQFHGGLPLICKRRRTGETNEENAQELRRQLVRFLEHCEELECANVTAVPALWKTGDLDVAAEEFAALCDLARPYGVRLCIEFMGTAPQVKDLAAAQQVAASAARSNGGVLIDTFLFHQGGSTLSQVEAIPLDFVFNVQLADAKHLPREQLNMLEDRLFPGTGSAPMRDIVAILSRRGYAGWWTVELFNPDYAASDPQAIARTAYETSAALIEEAQHTEVVK
jgi:2-keto-myo-inositol isomerase